MARKRLVYVSSTFVDLKEHRAALKSALEKAQYDVECMEKYPAFDERPRDKCLADVARADAYVLIVAHRYGFRPKTDNPEHKSITQLEYEEAGRHKGKPRLIFTVDLDHPWSAKWIDKGKDARDLKAFRAEVEDRHGVNRFTDPDQLASLVLQALRASEFLKGMDGDPLPPLRARAERQSELWLRENTSAGRYLPQVFGARPAMEAAIAEFLAGQQVGFVLTGESGIGKTTLLCHLIEQWRREGELVLAFHAQSLEIEQALEERILLDLNLSSDFADLVALLAAAERRLLLVLDGVNEHEAAPKLMQQISSFIQRYTVLPAGEVRPALKVLLSFRTKFLERLLEALPDAERDEARLFPEFAFMRRAAEGDAKRTSYRFELGPMELPEIEAAYEGYRAYRDAPDAPPRHCPSTPFTELDKDWHPVLANPFYLRILVEAYHGRAIPAQPWHGEIMRTFCELKIWGSEHDGHRYAARAALVDELVAQMRRQQAAALRKDALQALSPRWERALREEPTSTSPYRQLLEDGVLMETTAREIGGRAARTHQLVRFAFDTLFEYLLGDDILREGGGWDRLNGERLAGEVTRSRHFPYLAGAVEHLVLEAVDACNFVPLVELFGTLDAEVSAEVYEALSPSLTVVEMSPGVGLIYDRTGTPELFARLKESGFIERLLWKLFEWGDPASAPLSTVAGPTRGRGRPSRWHRHFKRLFEAIEVGADPRAAFNIMLWVAGRAGLMKDDQLTPLCRGVAYRIRSNRIDPADGERPASDERAAVLLIQAQALADAGRIDAAINMAGQAATRLEALTQDALELNGQLAECQIHLASFHGRVGHPAETVIHSRSGAQLLRDVPHATLHHKQLLVNALGFERRALQQQGADAEALLAERVELLRELSTSDGMDEYRASLADDLIELSASATDHGNPQRALELATEAVALCRSQAEGASDPEDAAPAPPLDALPQALMCQGFAFQRLDEASGAYNSFGEAIGIWTGPAREGDGFAIRMVMQALRDRCKLCETLERWDLVAVDVAAAFQLYFEICQDAEEPQAAVIDAFSRVVGWLRRLPGAGQERLYEAIGADNAAVVKPFVTGRQQCAG